MYGLCTNSPVEPEKQDVDEQDATGAHAHVDTASLDQLTKGSRISVMFQSARGKRKAEWFHGTVTENDVDQKQIRVLYDDKDDICHKYTALSNATWKRLSAADNSTTSPADNAGGLPPFLQMCDADIVLLRRFIPMVLAMPPKFANLPMRERAWCVARKGDLQSASFDKDKVSLFDLAPELARVGLTLGKDIDLALDSKGRLCNSPITTKAIRSISALWEYCTLVNSWNVPKLSHSCCELHLNGDMACDYPVKAYSCEITYSRYGRGTMDSEALNQFAPGVEPRLKKFVNDVCGYLLTAMAAQWRRTGEPFPYTKSCQHPAFQAAVLLSYPRMLGPPVTWKSDNSGCCYIATHGSARAAAPKVSADASAAADESAAQLRMSQQPAEDAHSVARNTRSRMFPSLLPLYRFPAHHYSQPFFFLFCFVFFP